MPISRMKSGVLSGPPVSTDSLSALGTSDASEASEDGDPSDIIFYFCGLSVY